MKAAGGVEVPCARSVSGADWLAGCGKEEEDRSEEETHCPTSEEEEEGEGEETVCKEWFDITDVPVGAAGEREED